MSRIRTSVIMSSQCEYALNDNSWLIIDFVILWAARDFQ
jgi:hypothetical protein